VRKVAYGNGKFVAVGDYGAASYSSDGITWTALPVSDTTGTTFGANRYVYAIGYGEEMFVIGGDYGYAAYSDVGLPPVVTSCSASGATVTTRTPTITLQIDEIGDCRASLSDLSYDDMAGQIDCTGDGTQSISCLLPDLGEDGNKTVYISCQDAFGHKSTSTSNTAVPFQLEEFIPVPSGGCRGSDCKTRDVSPQSRMTEQSVSPVSPVASSPMRARLAARIEKRIAQYPRLRTMLLKVLERVDRRLAAKR
jgi:hypothetical protein